MSQNGVFPVYLGRSLICVVCFLALSRAEPVVRADSSFFPTLCITYSGDFSFLLDPPDRDGEEDGSADTWDPFHASVRDEQQTVVLLSPLDLLAFQVSVAPRVAVQFGTSPWAMSHRTAVTDFAFPFFLSGGPLAGGHASGFMRLFLGEPRGLFVGIELGKQQAVRGRFIVSAAGRLGYGSVRYPDDDIEVLGRFGRSQFRGWCFSMRLGLGWALSLRRWVEMTKSAEPDSSLLPAQ
jgi:hypothetical protein